MDDYGTDLDNNSAKSSPQTGRAIRFLSICRKNRIFADYFSGKTFASPLEDYISAVSQSISNFQKKPERSSLFLQDEADHDLLSLFV